ncbi:MAG: beta-ketoacyl synthase N-terminal-like domain-containing protein [Calothrix sp. MO_167.B12]|nr:beta-ketoacyl synthase N-terminal-like domain-containing protein [Calothrix sp. MO_167.B12]
MKPIAIVGTGCRFPGANNLEAYWHLLKNGVDAIADIPQTRWNIDAFYDPDPNKPGKMNTRWGAFLEDVSLFDADFFAISPREAERMDPQHRLLMEVTWEALENAGISPDILAGSQTGVFIAIGNYDYGLLLRKDISRTDAYDGIGSSFSIAPNRLSYFLNLHGPSIAIDTACSSSLVALNLACHSLDRLESSVCLVGGINLIISPELNIALSKANMMASDGRCKTFDAKADGYVRGEGCGVVVLKLLEDAIRDGDTIQAVIKGIAINQDGMSNGLTAPNGPSQQMLIRQALENAQVSPAQISYLEAHGTGTPLGDPIEIEALKGALMPGRSPNQSCCIGSVKTNIGHLESAAGIASLIKVVLSLQHQQIPPSLHLKELNPYISLAGTPFSIPTECQVWSVDQETRLAGVSSFSIGGTNCHVILEEAPLATKPINDVERPVHLFTLSAKSEKALDEWVQHYEKFLISHPEVELADICFTGNVGRSHFDYRLAIVCQSTTDLHKQLGLLKSGQPTPGIFRGELSSKKRSNIAFLFTGQGSQYIGMGYELYQTNPTFRQFLEQCDTILRPYLNCSIISILFSSVDQPQLHQTEYAQPALFSLEYALAKLWLSWGIVPDAVIGHSLGEYVAACVAGVFSLEDGLKLVAERGRLMQSLPNDGVMAVVFSNADAIAEMIVPYGDKVVIAGVNSSSNTVISGLKVDVETLLQQLEATGIRTKLLNVSQAFHSPRIEPMLTAFAQVAEQVKYAKPKIRLISNLTGQLADESITTSQYWCRHAREAVQFAQGMQTLYNLGIKTFLEIGPSSTLIGMGRQSIVDASTAWLSSLHPHIGEWQQLLKSLGELYIRGYNINWSGFDQDYQRSRLSILPNYPFQRRRYWVNDDLENSLQLQPQLLQLWNSLVEAGRDQSYKGVLEYKLPTDSSQNQCMYQLCINYINIALSNLGAFSQDQAYTLDELIDRLAICPNYKQLVARWLDALIENGQLQKQGEYYTNFSPIQNNHLEELVEEVKNQWEGTPQLVEIIQRSGEHLAEILIGKEDIRALLFPGGSVDIMASLYQEAQFSSYYNAIAREAVQAVINNLSSNTSLRIIEIGAGTGGTTSWLLPILPEERSTYTFTDVSPLFLKKATKKFDKYPFVKYDLLNIEQLPQNQGYESHSYDIIVAANVLHATRNLEETLQNVKSLLAPGGILLAWEVTQPLLWFDVAFGPLVQPIEDEQLRQNQPFISVSQWQKLLESQGFRSVEAFPESACEADVLGQHILVAQAPIDTESSLAAFTVSTPGKANQQNLSHNLISQIADLDPEAHVLLGRRLRSPLPDVQFEAYLHQNLFPFIKNSPAFGGIILPASVQLEICLSAVIETFGIEAKVLKNISFQEVLSLTSGETKVIQSIFSETEKEKFSLRICSTSATIESKLSQWVLNCIGEFDNSPQTIKQQQQQKINFAEVQGRCSEEVSNVELYQNYLQQSLHYEQTALEIQGLWRKDNEVLSLLRLQPELALTVDNYYIHPILLDACIQLIGVDWLKPGINVMPENGYVPTVINEVQFDHKPGANIWLHLVLRSPHTSSNELVTADLYLFDEDKQFAASLIGLHLQPASVHKPELVRQLETALPNHRPEILGHVIRGEVGKVLNLSTPSEIGDHKGWFEMGMDSLTAVEFKNRLEVILGQNLPSTITFDYPNPEALVNYLLEKIFGCESSGLTMLEAHNGNTDQQNIAVADAELEQLSEDELVTLLAEELAQTTEFHRDEYTS